MTAPRFCRYCLRNEVQPDNYSRKCGSWSEPRSAAGYPAHSSLLDFPGGADCRRGFLPGSGQRCGAAPSAATRGEPHASDLVLVVGHPAARKSPRDPGARPGACEAGNAGPFDLADAPRSSGLRQATAGQADIISRRGTASPRLLSPHSGGVPYPAQARRMVRPPLSGISDMLAHPPSAEPALPRAEPRQRGSVARPISDGEHLPKRGIWCRRAEGALDPFRMVRERRPRGAVKSRAAPILLDGVACCQHPLPPATRRGAFQERHA